MPHFRHEFWLFFTHSSQKQAPHDLQTYIFSGENDLLHDVHFIIFTAFPNIIYCNYSQKNAIYTLSEKAESYPQKRTAKFTRRKNGNSRNKTIKTIKNSPKTQEKQPKPRQNNGFCSTWNKCGQLIVSRETYKNNTYQNSQNIPLFHVKRRFRKMWISFNHFASKLTYCQPIDIIVLRKIT